MTARHLTEQRAEAWSWRLTRLASALVTLWLTAMTLVYVWTAVRAVRNPFNGGADTGWVWVWLVGVTLALLSFWRGQPKWMLVVWLGSAAALALAVVALSGQSRAFLVCGWLLLLAVVWGDWLLTWLRVPASALLDRLTLALPLGFIVLFAVALALTVLHLLSPENVGVALLALTLLPTVRWWQRGHALPSFAGQSGGGLSGVQPLEQGLLVVAVAYSGLLTLTWAVAPEVQFDALSYHLTVPRLYVENGGLVNLAYFSHSYYARLLDFLYAVPLALNAVTATKLLSWSFAGLAALQVYALGRLLFSARVGLWAAALFYTTPLVSWLATTAYTDLAAVVLTLAALLAFVLWLEGRAGGWIVASGLLAGAALGTKPTAVFLLAGTGLAALLVLWRSRRLSPALSLKRAVVYGLGLGLVAAPVYLLVYTFTGSPFASLLQRDGGRIHSLVSLAFLSRFDLVAELRQWGGLPWQLTFQTGQYGEALVGGAVGIGLALWPCALVLMPTKRAAIRAVLGIAALGLVLWAIGHATPYARYYIAVLPVVLVLTVGAILALPSARRWRRLRVGWLGVALVAQIATMPLLFWQIPERFPLRLALGQESREEFLGRALPTIHAAWFLNTVTQPGERAVAVATEQIRFYLTAPLAPDWDDVAFADALFRLPPDQLATRLAGLGYRYLIVNDYVTNPTSAKRFLQPAFFQTYTLPVYRQGAVTVYRLLTQPRRQSPLNRVTNPGFETLDATGQPTGWIALGQPAVLRDGALAHEGQVAVHTDAANLYVQRITVRPGQVFTLSHYTRAAGPGPTARLQINWLDQGEQFVDTSLVVIPVGEQWRQHALTTPVPRGAVFGDIFLSVQDARDGVSFDDVALYEELSADP